jgi:hypothetical protein
MVDGTVLLTALPPNLLFDGVMASVGERELYNLRCVCRCLEAQAEMYVQYPVQLQNPPPSLVKICL